MEYSFPEHIIDDLDYRVLKNFAKKWGISKISSKNDAIQSIYTSLNNRDDIDYELAYQELILNSVHYTNNRDILTSYISISRDSILNSSINNSEKELEPIDYVFDIDNINSELNIVFRNPSYDNDRLSKLDVVLGKRYDVERKITKDGREVFERFDYIWVTIDIDKRKLVITRHDKSEDEEFTNSVMNVFQVVTAKLSDMYGFKVQPSDESESLYKFFYHLTKDEELHYLDKAKESTDLRNSFSEAINSMYNFTDLNETQEWNTRLENLISRRLIRQDFSNFSNRDVDDGKVLKIRFIDDLGGKVEASAGGASGNREIDFQESDVYFDTKDTIHLAKRLKSITIQWKLPKYLLDIDDRIEFLPVKYTVYGQFYVTHIERFNLLQEVAEYVLPKFEDYKRLSY